MQLRSTPLRPFRSALAVSIAALATAALLGGLVLAQESPQPPEDWQLTGDPARARATYDKFCATCHGAEGHGDGVMAKFLEPKPKDLSDADYMDARSDYEIYLAIKKGGAAVGLSDKMAPWEQLLAEQEIQDLTVLVRGLSQGP